MTESTIWFWSSATTTILSGRATAAPFSYTSLMETIGRQRAAWRSRARICWRSWPARAPAIAWRSKSRLSDRRRRRTFAENRRAHAHMRGAETDGGFVVAAHAHAENGEAVAAGDLAQQRKMQRRLLLQRRNAH